jgi:hypothetical protein
MMLAHGQVTTKFSTYLFIQTLGQNVVNHIKLYTLNSVKPTFLMPLLLLYHETIGKWMFSHNVTCYTYPC